MKTRKCLQNLAMSLAALLLLLLVLSKEGASSAVAGIEMMERSVDAEVMAQDAQAQAANAALVEEAILIDATVEQSVPININAERIHEMVSGKPNYPVELEQLNAGADRAEKQVFEDLTQKHKQSPREGKAHARAARRIAENRLADILAHKDTNYRMGRQAAQLVPNLVADGYLNAANEMITPGQSSALSVDGHAEYQEVVQKMGKRGYTLKEQGQSRTDMISLLLAALSPY